MVKVFRTHPEHNSFYKEYPIAVGIKNYTYFMSYQELQDIPFSNTQPTFDPLLENLSLQIIEDNGILSRVWVIEPITEEEQENADNSGG